MNSTEVPLHISTSVDYDYEDNFTTAYDYDDYTMSTTPCDQDSTPILSMVLPVVLYLVFCLGLLGNASVVWVLLRYIRLKSMTDVCLLNLALSDLLLVLSLPLWAHNFLNQQGFDGPASCKLMKGVYQLGFYSGTLFVTLMSVDRYLAIVHAVAAMRARKLCYGAVASVTIWVISIIMTIPEVIFATMVPEYENEEISSLTCQSLYPEETATRWKMFRNFGENTVGLFVSLPIMTFCYMRILVVVQRSRNSKKNRAMKLIFTIVCVFIVCWVPYNVIVFLETLQLFDILNNCHASNMINSALSVTESIALAHCCANPIIYAFVGEKFRKSLTGVLSRYKLFKQFSRQDVTNRGSENETSNTPVS